MTSVITFFVYQLSKIASYTHTHKAMRHPLRFIDGYRCYQIKQSHLIAPLIQFLQNFFKIIFIHLLHIIIQRIQIPVDQIDGIRRNKPIQFHFGQWIPIPVEKLNHRLFRHLLSDIFSFLTQVQSAEKIRECDQIHISALSALGIEILHVADTIQLSADTNRFPERAVRRIYVNLI